MPGVDTGQIHNAFGKDQIGKSKSILEACLHMGKREGIRAVSRLIRVPYYTVHGWLVRMKDANLERRFDHKHPGQKPNLDKRA